MQIKKRRSKKQQKRKEKEKKQRKRVAPEKATVAPSTMGGRLGEMVDRYRRMTMKEYNDVVEMCQMHGVPVSKAVLGKGKAVQGCSFPNPFTAKCGQRHISTKFPNLIS